MPLATNATTDLIEELRLRRWARENYAPAADRDSTWHPIVIDEMNQRDLEEADSVEDMPSDPHVLFPLPESRWTLHDSHIEHMRSAILLRLPSIESDPATT